MLWAFGLINFWRWGSEFLACLGAHRQGTCAHTHELQNREQGDPPLATVVPRKLLSPDLPTLPCRCGSSQGNFKLVSIFPWKGQLVATHYPYWAGGGGRLQALLFLSSVHLFLLSSMLFRNYCSFRERTTRHPASLGANILQTWM